MAVWRVDGGGPGHLLISQRPWRLVTNVVKATRVGLANRGALFSHAVILRCHFEDEVAGLADKAGGDPWTTGEYRVSPFQ